MEFSRRRSSGAQFRRGTLVGPAVAICVSLSISGLSHCVASCQLLPMMRVVTRAVAQVPKEASGETSEPRTGSPASASGQWIR